MGHQTSVMNELKMVEIFKRKTTDKSTSVSSTSGTEKVHMQAYITNIKPSEIRRIQ